MPNRVLWVLIGVLCLTGCRTAAAGSRVLPPSAVARGGDAGLINLDGGTLLNLDGGTLQAKGTSTTSCLARALRAEPVAEAVPGAPLAVSIDASRAGLRYAWEASEGTVSGADRADVSWTVPGEPGSHSLTAIVSDAAGASATLTWTVVVSDEGATVTPPAPGACR